MKLRGKVGGGENKQICLFRFLLSTLTNLAFFLTKEIALVNFVPSPPSKFIPNQQKRCVQICAFCCV